MSVRRFVRRTLPAALTTTLVAALGLTAAPSAGAQAPAQADRQQRLYVVALNSPQQRVPGMLGVIRRVDAVAQQNLTLASVDAGTPVYRWTHALNGYAVELDAAQARELRAHELVAAVEPDSRRRLAGIPSGGTELPGSAYASGRGGRGTVIGVVDSGLAPESPLFAVAGGLGPRPAGFSGGCATGEDWGRSACNGKVAGARWFVDGFGRDRLASSASLSPRDDTGHGTQVASLAAGNAGVSIEIGNREHGRYSGVAPQSRLAIYKACWTAPDPAHDGCSTADLVSAVDAAVDDGVDVLNLSVSGGDGYDVLERALLGAAESDVVVVAAAGFGPTTAHPAPWVTTVGASSGEAHVGAVRLGSDGPRLEGAMLATRDTDRLRVVLGRDAAAPGSSRSDARLCRPGSLDDREVAGAIVVCERGEIGRVDKSAAVELAEGAGMVLLNLEGRDDVSADLHSVPTVHLRRDESRALTRWARSHRSGRARLVSVGTSERPARILRRSAGGDPSAGVVKPDLVAPGAGLLGAVPPDVRRTRWDFLTGTSGAAAQVSGLAAVLRSRHGWSATRIRSLLSTSTTPVRARVLRRGAGEATRQVRPGLVFDVAREDYRRFLEGRLGRGLNTPSVAFTSGHGTVQRRVTNVSGRTLTWNASMRGFDGHTVRVSPPAMTLRPGQTRTFQVTVEGPPTAHPVSEGLILWRAPGTSDVRIPVLLGR